MIVGDRPDDLRPRCDFLSARLDLIITTRRARPDGGRPDRRGGGRVRRAAAGARSGAGGADLGDHQRAAGALARRLRRGRCGPATASRRWCRGGRRCSSRWAPRPGWSCPVDGGPWWWSCRGRRASCSRCGRWPSRRRRWRAAILARRGRSSSASCGSPACPSPSSLPCCARARRRRRRSRSRPACGGASWRSRRCSRGTRRRMALEERDRRSLRRAGVLARRVDDRRDRRGAAGGAAGADGRGCRVVHGRADGGRGSPTARARRRTCWAAWWRTRTRPRWRSRACPELIARFGAVSPRGGGGAGGGRRDAVRRRRSGSGSPASPARRRDAGEAGRDGAASACRRRAVVARHVQLPGDRADIRDRTTTLAMHLLRRASGGEQPPVGSAHRPHRAPAPVVALRPDSPWHRPPARGRRPDAAPLRRARAADRVRGRSSPSATRPRTRRDLAAGRGGGAPSHARLPRPPAGHRRRGRSSPSCTPPPARAAGAFAGAVLLPPRRAARAVRGAHRPRRHARRRSRRA